MVVIHWLFCAVEFLDGVGQQLVMFDAEMLKAEMAICDGLD